MWVAAFLGVGDGRGRKQADCSPTLPNPLPQPGVLPRTFQQEAWRKLGKWGRQDAQGKREEREQMRGVSERFWACTHNVPASQAYFHTHRLTGSSQGRQTPFLQLRKVRVGKDLDQTPEFSASHLANPHPTSLLFPVLSKGVPTFPMDSPCLKAGSLPPSFIHSFTEHLLSLH